MIIENTPILETERLILRKFTEEDTEALFLIMSDKEANTFLPWFPLETLDEAVEFLHHRFLSAYRLPGAYHYAVCLKSDLLPIGYINISDNDSHDLGYGLRTDYSHKGMITEACKAVVDRLFQAGFPYLTATHDINNPRSGAVMKKIGMTYQYSYEERVQPKDMQVIFRMYQLNFHVPQPWVYREYWDNHTRHFVEDRRLHTYDNSRSDADRGI